MTDRFKLGRLPRPDDAQFRRLSQYQRAPLPEAPPSWDGTWGCVYRMLGNDRYGDCTFATMAHLAMTQAACEGRSWGVEEDDVVRAYLDFTGNQDVGAVEVGVLDRVRQAGFPLDGSWRIDAWASVNPKDPERLKAACALFHGLYCGVALPASAQRQMVWDVPDGQPLVGEWAPDSWGGHAVPIVGYDAEHAKVITWGQPLLVSWRWLAAYLEESYVVLDASRRDAYDPLVRYDELVADVDALRQAA